MRTNRSRKFRKIIALGAAGLILTAVEMPARSPDGSLVAHEWGTFTSFQAADGALLKWRTLASAGLPKFVHHWDHPGAGLQAIGDPALTPPKSEIYSLQRMETPVIYLYSKHAQTADVQVDFPQGLITEWYPKASQYGPSKQLVDWKGVPSPGYTAGSDAKQSLIRWSDLAVMPSAAEQDAATLFPQDASGSHYFAARETDANPVRTSAQAASGAVENEKFLFYRGIGNFATPLVVTMPSDGSVTIENKGTEAISKMFVLGMKSGFGGFEIVKGLARGAKKTVPLPVWRETASMENMKSALGAEMARALVAEGLYPREAQAMVNTWKDSWFSEDGVRVLYLLPRGWTDRTLPMRVNPAPKQLVRVMVGRAEVLTPDTERTLTALLPKVKENDSAAARQAEQILARLGRFAEPTFERTVGQLMRNAQPEEIKRLFSPLAYAEHPTPAPQFE